MAQAKSFSTFNTLGNTVMSKQRNIEALRLEAIDLSSDINA